MFAPGVELIPGLRLRQPLGSGGFGTVWEAHTSDGDRLAVKGLDCRHLPPALVANEIRVLVGLRDLRHPHIIQLRDVCAVAGHILLTMECAHGNLKELQLAYLEERGTSIPPDQLLDLLGQAAEALDFLAGQRPRGLRLSAHTLQHCDVKPSNLLVVGDQLKVADFGLCTSALRSGGPGFLGTQPYAAPEQFEGRVSSRSDQFALAVTYCELVAGDRPFLPLAATEPPHYRMPIDLRKLRAKECQVLARALDPRWLNRWPNCREFIHELRRAAQAPRGAAPLASFPRRAASSPAAP